MNLHIFKFSSCQMPRISNSCLSPIRDNFYSHLWSIKYFQLLTRVLTCLIFTMVATSRSRTARGQLTTSNVRRVTRGMGWGTLIVTERPGHMVTTGQFVQVSVSQIFGSQHLSWDISCHTLIWLRSNILSVCHVSLSVSSHLNIIVFQAETKHDFVDFNIWWWKVQINVSRITL